MDERIIRVICCPTSLVINEREPNERPITSLDIAGRRETIRLTKASITEEISMNIKPTSKPKAAAWPFRLKKILVPTDFSRCSENALEYALPIARQFRAGIVLVHVIHVDYYAVSGDYAALDYPALIEDLRGSEKKQL